MPTKIVNKNLKI